MSTMLQDRQTAEGREGVVNQETQRPREKHKSRNQKSKIQATKEAGLLAIHLIFDDDEVSVESDGFARP